MATITFKEAVSAAIREEMLRNSRIVFMGQDIEFAFDEETKRRIGPERIRNTPISEAGFVGAGLGAALTGMPAIVELGCSTFLYSAMDQVINQAAKSRYMFGGQASAPLVIRAPVFYGISVAAHHSDRPWGLFAQAPGLKVIVPTTPYDAKGLLKAALRDGNPVLCFEDYGLRDHRGEVAEGDYTVPIGRAEIRRRGSDVTIVAVAASVHDSIAAAELLQQEGISPEVIDILTVAPLDRRTIIDSVRKTGRLIVVDPAPLTCGIAAEVAASVAENAFEHLRAPILRVTAPDVPIPFSPALERQLYPTVDRIVAAVRRQVHPQLSARTPTATFAG